MSGPSNRLVIAYVCLAIAVLTDPWQAKVAWLLISLAWMYRESKEPTP